MRASRQFGSVTIVCSTSPITGANSRAGSSRSLRVVRSVAASDDASRHPVGKAAAEAKPPPRARNTAAVDTATPGLISTIPASGSRGADTKRSPMPDIHAGRPEEHTGTSAPSPRVTSFSRSGSGWTRHSRHNRRSVAAASADPPPIPEATGRFFSRTMRPVATTPVSVGQSAGGTQHKIVGLAAQPGCERPCHGQRQVRCLGGAQPVTDRCEHDQAVQQVIAILPPPDDMQVQVDFGRRAFGQDFRHARCFRVVGRSCAIRPTEQAA